MIHIMRYLQNLPAFNLLCNPQAPTKVLREHGARETVVSVIGNFNGFLVARDFDDRYRRTKRFGVEELHVLVYPINDDRSHACCRRFVCLWVFLISLMVTVYDFGAILNCIRDKTLVLLYTRCGYEHRCRLIATKNAFHGALESFNELWLDVLVSEDTF